MSTGQLWPILNPTVLMLLGYSKTKCGNEVDWSSLINLASSVRSNYKIRYPVIPSSNSGDDRIAFKIVDSVGPNTCKKRDTNRSSNALYLFNGSKFRVILNRDAYLKLGYKSDYSEVVDITQDLFDYYGESVVPVTPAPDYVAIFSDGWHYDNRSTGDGRSQPILDAYFRYGGVDRLGLPFDNGGTLYAHNWPSDDPIHNVIIQDFKNTGLNKYGTDGETALVYNRGQNQCYLLKEGFWGIYKPPKYQVPAQYRYLYGLFGPHDLGAPKEDERRDSADNNIVIQDFDRGKLSWDSVEDVWKIMWNNDAPPPRRNLQSYRIIPQWKQTRSDLGKNALVSGTLVSNVQIQPTGSRQQGVLARSIFAKSRVQPAAQSNIRISWGMENPPPNGKIAILYSLIGARPFQQTVVSGLSISISYYDWVPPFTGGTQYWIEVVVIDEYGMVEESVVGGPYLYTPPPPPTATSTLTPLPTRTSTFTPKPTNTPLPPFTPTPTKYTLPPKPTNTPSFTPSPTLPLPNVPVIWVTDDEQTTEDLSNGEDHDPANARKLVIRWDYKKIGIDQQNVVDVLVYAQVNEEDTFVFVGRTGMGTNQYFTWESAGLSENGPKFNSRYRFFMCVLAKDPQSYLRFFGPFASGGAVRFLEEVATVPTSTPTPTNTPLPTGVLPQTIIIDLPNLPSGAKPLEMVRIYAGTFMLGSQPNEGYDFEKPQHQATITKDFYLGKYELTQAQWNTVMSSNPSRTSAIGNNYPVHSVSWNNCQTFISNLNQLGLGTFRLPTEAEWEYACRAGTTTQYYWGDDSDGTQIDSYAWYSVNSSNNSSYPHEVGLKLPNAWGLFDMSGNVLEWCQNWYYPYTNSPEVDPNGPSSGSEHISRGGNSGGMAWNCRSAERGFRSPNPDSTGVFYGIRLLKEILIPTPTNTPTSTPTNTPIPTYTPTLTWTPTITGSPTFTPTLTLTTTTIGTPITTYTLTPTNTPLPTNSLTPTTSLTNTPSPTNTALFTPTEILTATKTPSLTPLVTPTNILTLTLTPTYTFIPTNTPTITPTDTPIPTLTFTPSPTDTPLPTFTPTATNTPQPPTLTPTNTPTPTLPPASLRLVQSQGQCVYISHANQQGLGITGDITIELWIRIDQLPSVTGVPQEFVAKYNPETDSRSYVLYLESDNALHFICTADGTKDTPLRFASSDPFLIASDVGRWVHVAAAIDVDGQAATFYKNSSPVPLMRLLSLATVIYNGSAPFVIGAQRVYGVDCFDGLIDDVCVWNRTRSAAEIASDYNRELTGSEPGLMGYWKFNGDLQDATANGNHLSAVNGATFGIDTPF